MNADISETIEARELGLQV